MKPRSAGDFYVKANAMIPRKFRNSCVACGAIGAKMNKEHFWPQWLIERTGTHRTAVRFTTQQRINPKSLVVPLCVKCNTDFGRELESPASYIFNELEAGRGISDYDAELLIRWLWKFEGLYWSFSHPSDNYSDRYTVRDRVLNPIDDVRERLILAVSLVEAIDPTFGDAPMGIDSWNENCAIFVSGVFSRVALMVLDSQFEKNVPPQFSIYRPAKQNAADRSAKLFFPKFGFHDCTEAVVVTKDASMYLSYAHDLVARTSAHGRLAPL
jgi:hypothetical protein